MSFGAEAICLVTNGLVDSTLAVDHQRVVSHGLVGDITTSVVTTFLGIYHTFISKYWKKTRKKA